MNDGIGMTRRVRMFIFKYCEPGREYRSRHDRLVVTKDGKRGRLRFKNWGPVAVIEYGE